MIHADGLTFVCVSLLGFPVMELLFSEELGLVLEVSQLHLETVCQRYSDAGIQCHRLGTTCGFGPESMVRVSPQRLSENTFYKIKKCYLIFRLLFTWTDVKY